MGADFSQPQRQSVIGILVMFFYTLQQYARALWPMIVIWVFKFDEVNKAYFLLGMLAVFVSIGAGDIGALVPSIKKALHEKI